LGHGDSKDYEAVARVIMENCDIAAIVEVMQKQGGHPGYDRLLQELGSGWAGMVTDEPRPNTGSGNSEHYGVVWFERSVAPCRIGIGQPPGPRGLQYYPDGDGTPGDDRPDLFAREPAFGCFQAIRYTGGSTCVSHGNYPGTDGPCLAETVRTTDFLLGIYHATWAGGERRIIRDEVAQLGLVFDEMSHARPGERDRLILGDFNLVPDELADILPYEDRTEGTGSTLNSDGEITDNLYDHVLVRDPVATSEMVGNAQVLDVRDVAGSPAEFYRTVSDHLPIAVRLRVDGEDDD